MTHTLSLRHWFIGLAILLIVGCVSTQSYHFYTLRAIESSNLSVTTGFQSKHVGIIITSVLFPDYLDRPQMVTRPTMNTLRIHEFHRWGGSLKADFAHILNENLLILLESQPVRPPGSNTRRRFVNYHVSLIINQFEGTLGEQVVLDVNWKITEQGNKKQSWLRRVVIRQPVESNNHEQLAISQSLAVKQLSYRIIEMVREISGGT